MEGLQLFGDNRITLIAFKMFPILTDYKDVGMRSYVPVNDYDHKVQATADIAMSNGGVNVADIVNNDLNIVKLENEASDTLMLDGGVSATRYQFTIIVDERKPSGNIERLFIRGYTSAIDMNSGNGGTFSRAIPDDALFYIDSVTTVTYIRRINGNGYVATNNIATDNILSNNEDTFTGDRKELRTIRPKDVVVSSSINSIQRDNDMNGYDINGLRTNLLTINTNTLSKIGNNNNLFYTKELLNGMIGGVVNETSGGGYDGAISDRTSILRNCATQVVERSLVDIGLGRKLTEMIRKSKISVLTVTDIKQMLGTYTLDGIVDVIDHDMNDVSLASTTMVDIDLLGQDTLTVGVHTFYNNMQHIINSYGLSDINLVVVMNYNNIMDPLEVVVSNYNSILGDEDIISKLPMFKKFFSDTCVKELDKYLKFDEEVQRVGGYSVVVDYKFFVDTVITLNIGNEEMIFRFPNFAGSQFTPVLCGADNGLRVTGIGMQYESVLDTVMSQEQIY